MKNILLILSSILFATGCGQEESNQNVITENATVYYQWVDIGFADIRCTYILEINNIYFCTDNIKIEHTSTSNSIRVKAIYKVTDAEVGCTSQVFYGVKQIKVIEILSIEKL